MGERFDAVVIGAGPNGLVAANMLADAGWSVVVLEAGPTPGGAVRSAELTAPGFLSDVCSSFYPLGVASPPLRALELTEYGLRWAHAPQVLAHLLPDGRAAVLSRDVDATANSLDAFGAGDGLAWRQAYREWLHLEPHLLDALFRPFPPVRPALALLGQLRTAGALRLARRFLLPVRAFGQELFAGEGARALLAGLALHTDLNPDETGSAVFGWLLAMLGQQHGFPAPVGGAQRLTDALVARLRARGGDVVCDAPVVRVPVSAGRALGVVTADGRGWRARRAVVADVPATTLLQDLVGAGHLPGRLVADLDNFHWDSSTLKIDWALSGPVPWINPAVAGAGTVHLGADVAGLATWSTQLANGEVPPHPFLLVGQMTTTDPTRSPQGTQQLWAYTHLPRRRGRWSGQEIDGYAERVEQVLEAHAPGFRALVRGRYVASPDRLQAENPSLVGGAINGGTAAAYQQLFLRPVPGLGRPDLPIDRLYLASSSAHPGGGVHGGPGANAALAALRRSRPGSGTLYRAAVRAANRAVYPD